jgi:hypothetical protein
MEHAKLAPARCTSKGTLKRLIFVYCGPPFSHADPAWRGVDQIDAATAIQVPAQLVSEPSTEWAFNFGL